MPRAHGLSYRTGHEVQLLQGSTEFFPALIAGMDAARHSIWLETYIFDFTGSAQDVAQALARAAQRGVAVRWWWMGWAPTPCLRCGGSVGRRRVCSGGFFLRWGRGGC